MKDILHIARKEFKDTVRDKRTLMAMIVVPLLLFPVIFTLVSGLQSESMEKAMSRDLKVAVAGSQVPAELQTQLETGENLRLIPFGQDTSYRRYVRSDSLDAAIAVTSDFQSRIDNMQTGRIQLFFQSTEEGVEQRLTNLLDQYGAKLRRQRLAMLDISEEAIQPVQVEKKDMATMN